VRIAIICDNFSPHLTTRKDKRVGQWAAASNVEAAYTPANASWLNRIEPQLTALRYFALDGTDHATHQEQGSMIRRYITWRNNHAYDERLRSARSSPARPPSCTAPVQPLRRGCVVVGARGSWTVVAGRSSIERGIGCFRWVSCDGLGLVPFLPGLVSEGTARRGAAVPSEPRRGRPARVINGCWRAVW
jgi:hypothetical protein